MDIDNLVTLECPKCIDFREGGKPEKLEKNP